MDIKLNAITKTIFKHIYTQKTSTLTNRRGTHENAEPILNLI